MSSAVRQLPDSVSWTLDRINNLIGAPWNLKGADQAEKSIGGGRPCRSTTQPRSSCATTTSASRGRSSRSYIRIEHLSKYGYSEGCMKCRSIREGFQITRGHSGWCGEAICEQMPTLRKLVESKKARFVAPESAQEDLPPNSGGPRSHLVREVEKKSLMEPGLRRL